jgi:hypothetical protein
MEFFVSHPSHKCKVVARVGHPLFNFKEEAFA